MEEFTHLLFSWPHWMFEVISDVLFAGVGLLWVKYHDRRNH